MVSDILISPPEIGTKGFGFDAFMMPAYHEKVSTNPIPPVSVTDVTMEFVSTNAKPKESAPVQEEIHEADIVTISREELDAKLAQSKAEVNSVAAAMRQEMSEWREQQNAQISQLTSAINILSSKIDGKMDSVDGVVKSFDGKLEGIQGRIDGMGTAISGINTAITGIQSGLSTKLTVFGIIITVVIALVGFGAAFFGKATDSVKVSQPAPIVIQVPLQQSPIQNNSQPLTNK
ncbi:hypothetical protein ACMU9U_003594 [Yersinia enterocolitica]|nr:hypothetical protein [Yersinia enterocolitica]HEF7268400.1 hypothetical protein [Yersinia enterocolitica]